MFSIIGFFELPVITKLSKLHSYFDSHLFTLMYNMNSALYIPLLEYHFSLTKKVMLLQIKVVIKLSL